MRLSLATHPDGPFAPDVTNQYVRWGSSPRGVQTLVLAAKVRALLDSRFNVGFEDLRRVYLPALRHRILLNFEAQAEGDRPRRRPLEGARRRPREGRGGGRRPRRAEAATGVTG